MRFNTKWKSVMLVAISLFGVAAFAAVTKAALEEAPAVTTATEEGTTEEETTEPTEEEAVAEVDPIDGEWTVIKSYSFDDKEEDVYTAKTAATYSDETVSISGVACNLGTGEFDGLAFQGANKFFYYNGGLYQGNGGGRKVGVLDVEKGQRVTIVATGSSLALATTDVAELESQEGETYVYNIIADGNLGVTMTRYFVIKSISIEAKTKLITAHSWSFDTKAEDVYTAKTAATYSDETVSISGVACNLGTGEFEGLAFQGANKFFYYNGGLYQGNGGGRKVGILGVEEGQIVTIVATGSSLALATTDIATLDESASSGDTLVYNIVKDGDLGFTMTRYFVIKSILVQSRVQLNTTVWSFDTKDEDVYTAKTAATYSDETVSIGGIACNLGTGEFEGLAFQGANKFFYYNGGLYQGNGGGRKVGVLGMESGAVVTIVATEGSLTLVDNGVAELASQEGETYVYNIIADGDLGVTMTRYNVIKSITVVAPKASLKAPEVTVADHKDWEVAEISLACSTKDAVIYYTLGEDTVLYSEPFTVSKSVTVTAWSEKNGKSSKVVTKSVVAGYVATPTATITKVAYTTREVTLATVAEGAKLYYYYQSNRSTISAVPLEYTKPVIIGDTTLFKVYAKLGEFVSDTLTTTVAAGTEVQLAGVTFAVAAVADSALAVEYEAKNLKDIIVTADQSSVLCTPTAQIQYTFKAIDETTGRPNDFGARTATVNSGDTIKAVGIGYLSAVAKNVNYATSEENYMWVKKPSVLTAERVYDFSRAAWGEHTSDLTVTIGSAETTVNGTEYGSVTIDGTLVDGFLVQTGTTWLKRGGYDGFYQMNGGGRGIAVTDLQNGQVVQLYGHYGNGNFDLTLVDNGVATKDVAESVDNSVYTYRIVAAGTLALTMARYGYLDSIIVSSDPNMPKTPKVVLQRADNETRYVAMSVETLGGDIYYSVGVPNIQVNETSVTTQYLTNDTVGGVAPIYADTVIVTVTNDTIVEWSEYQLYGGKEVAVAPEVQYVKAYTLYQDNKSDEVTLELPMGVLTVNDPVITFVEKVEGGKVFEISVDNSNITAENPQAIYYTLPGAEPVLYKGKITIPDTMYGWMTAVSAPEGYEASSTVYRYLDARASYNETYEAVVAETEVLPAEAADFEIADVATLNATLNAAFKPSGRIYFHKNVHAGYNMLVLPFSMTNTNLNNGSVYVTDAAGNVLTRGEDYTIYRIQATTAFDNIESALEAGTLTHTGNIVANTQSYMIKVADALVGQDLIFVSLQNAQTISINSVDLTTAPAEGKFRVVNNATFAPVVAEIPVYLLNEAGDALVLQPAGSLLTPFSIAVVADESFNAAHTVLPLVAGATGIENIDAELREQGMIFDLMGRRVLSPKAGQVYLRDGKKFIQH
jgi:hypothetical protein